MAGIPRELMKPLRQALIDCYEFDQNRTLRSLFDDARLKPFKNNLPEADSTGERADLTISYLVNKNLVNGENALMLLVQVLSEKKDPADELRDRLAKLVGQLDWLGHIDPKLSTYKPEANPGREPMLQALEIEQMYQTARAVAHLDVPRYISGQQRESFSGTAWMIAPTLAVTCAHVLRARSSYETLDEADFQYQIKNALLIFDFLSAGRGTPYKILKSEYQNEELDYALLRLEERAQVLTDQWGYLRLALSDTPLTTQTSLVIIQHPLGQPKQGAFGKFAQQDTQAGTIYYRTPTEPGTSGAPILNRQNWQVMALHQGESTILELRQGRLMSTILADLQAKQPILYQEILNAQNRRP